MDDSKIANMTASELTEQYSLARLSPVTVTEAMLDRINRINPKINAFHHISTDKALKSAREAEKRWKDGKPLSPIDGVPTAIKDGLLMKGIPVYRGSVANAAEMQEWNADAPVVLRLEENGAVILGKTTMCDYGMLASGYSSKFGPTRNPWSLDHNSGGSSSGSAAAVAAGRDKRVQDIAQRAAATTRTKIDDFLVNLGPAQKVDVDIVDATGDVTPDPSQQQSNVAPQLTSSPSLIERVRQKKAEIVDNFKPAVTGETFQTSGAIGSEDTYGDIGDAKLRARRTYGPMIDAIQQKNPGINAVSYTHLTLPTNREV